MSMSTHLSLAALLLLLVLLVCCGATARTLRAADVLPHVGTKLGNTTVFGAMIMTDPDISSILGRDFHKVPQGVNGTTANNAMWRIENGKNTANQLPFHVDFWLSLHAPGCPNRKNKGNDRGVAFSHYQIWRDFVFQGNKFKDVVSDGDVLVVLEDDAVIAVTDVNKSLEAELGQMTTDHVFLGWCYGRRYMPMCTHAYAITRGALRRLVDNFDICYPQAIDAQLRLLSDRGIFSWRKPDPSSYNNLRPGFEDNPNYFTRGIFVQKNGLVSFNHHGFQNNAG